MPYDFFDLREFFHLSFLRHLSLKLIGRTYAVKGGICLRFFHRSPRLSMDMDLDIESQVSVDRLKKIVDSILENRSFLSAFVPHSVTGIRATKTKQTETTQRWKVGLRWSGKEPLPTKIEFSRRTKGLKSSSGIPDAELLSHYKTAPFAVLYYDTAQMAIQKIRALASHSRYAVRDLFDLHHLLSTAGGLPENLRIEVDSEEIERAANKVEEFSFREFKEQVLPFLSEAVMTLYREPKAFEDLKDEVGQALIRMMS